MSIIIGNSIQYSYPSSSNDILKNLDFSISQISRIGLIGKNGSGKTTLLKILTGEINDFSGSLQTYKNLQIAYLKQKPFVDCSINAGNFLWLEFDSLFRIKLKIDELESTNSEIASEKLAYLYSQFQEKSGFSIEAKINSLLPQFGFSKCDLKRDFASFSGGEKTKFSLLRILLNSPNLLLLDEPTNHLDLESLEWLESYLKSLKIPHVVISHDRKFLDNCTNETWELKNGKLNVFTGNYSFYENSVKNKLERQLETYKQKCNEVEKLQIASESKNKKANKLENFKPKRSIAKNGRICKRDDGSTKGVRVKNQQKSAAVMQKRLNREIDKTIESKPFIEKQYKIEFSKCNIKNKFVLHVENLSKSFDDLTLFSNKSFSVETGERIAISGKNGSGKTTLLKILNSEIQADSGFINWAPNARIGYYSQEFEHLNNSETILDEVIQGDYENQTRVIIILGCLGITKNMANQVISTLSEGEKSKTALTRLLFLQPDVLLLDEPTNHLEISSRISLEEALSDFEGTIILISHDRYFAEKIVNRQIIID